MGCPCELRLFADDAETLAEECIAEIRRFESKYSRYREESTVGRINAAAGLSAVAIDDETDRILDYAAVCYELSDGRFDITSGVLRTVWRDDLTRLPTEEDISGALSRIGWPRVERKPGSIYLPVKGMEIDLGGVVKEYAADAVVSLLHAQGVRHGLVNLGGDIAIVGPRPGDRPWDIGIADPASPERAIATIRLDQGAVTTSGGYERFIEIDGQRFSHLLDPLTGWPVRNLSGVSVIAQQAVVAGSLSTIALLKEEGEALAWLETSGAVFLAISTDGAVHGSLSG